MILHLSQQSEVIHMLTLILTGVASVGGGFVAGLLVGRRNPGIANAVATLASKAKEVDPKAEVDKVVAAVKTAIRD
jgi:hypothetical protein